VGQAPPAVAPFTDADVKRIAALPAAEQVEEVRKELIKRNPRFDGTLTPTIVSGYVHGLKFHTGEVDDIAPLRALKTLTSLDCGCSSESRGKLSDLSPLKDLPLTWLELSYNLVKDLAPLEGMRLTYLVLDYSPNVSDLSPLKGMPLTRLGMGATRVTDLTPLEGMKLDFLNLWTTPVRNLEALKGMPITNLNIDRTGVTNLTPLQGMNLNEIHLIPRNISQGLDVLRNMQSLKTIGTSVNPFPAAEFWERYDKGEFGFAPFSDAEVKRIAALPAAEQIEEVRKELMRRNPSFDGIVEHKIEGDTVIELRINTDKVTDIAPIRVFSTLRVLDCGASYTDKPNGLLAELSSLNGMNLSALTHLNLNQTKIDDAGLANFKDCKNLLELRLWNTKSTDTGLANFKGCNKLTSLDLGGTQVSDAGLANFKDCKDLTALYLHWTKMSDAGLVHFLDCKDLTQISLAGTRLSDAGLAQIKNCKYLKHLSLDHMKIGDTGLAHFKDIPLTSLWIDNTGITDLTPLQVMPLEAIHLTPKNIKKGLDVLRDMKSLKTIGIAWKQEWPATEFWERYDKGEFTK
jgi:Leucine-rich repeat (LRR) protein